MTAGSAAPSLRRALGLWQVTAAGVGVILGAGVYALIGPAAAHAGQALWLAFLVAGVAALLTGYSYARLGAMRPRASPEFQYTALAFGPDAGFVAGWLMLVGDVSAAASVALGFGGYLTHVTGAGTTAGALGLVLLAGAAVYAGIAHSVRLAIALTAVEAAGLLFVIAVGLPAWPQAGFGAMPGVGGVLSASALIFFAYLGFDELGNLAEEMRAPERDLPRALYLALAVTTVVYVAVALSATAVVSADALAASPAPLALVVRRVLGPAADTALSVMALAATANTVLLLLLAGSRSVYGMASDGVLPGRLARLSRTRIPGLAMAVVLAGAAVLVLAGDLSGVARLTDAVVLTSFICVNASLVWLGARGRTAGGPWRRVADVVVPALGALLCAALLAENGWVWIAASLAIGLAGAAVRAVTVRRRRAA
ncbi:MAG TPA: amino acid permease [Methylomirabilota bacterium]|nr:amino acid permease [Methylomirabilota bacterium]